MELLHGFDGTYPLTDVHDQFNRINRLVDRIAAEGSYAPTPARDLIELMLIILQADQKKNGMAMVETIIRQAFVFTEECLEQAMPEYLAEICKGANPDEQREDSK